MTSSFLSDGFSEYKVSLISIATRHVLQDVKGSRIQLSMIRQQKVYMQF